MFSKSFAMAVKDLKLLVRDRGGAFFVFIFPLMMAIFFGTAFSGSFTGGGGSAGIDLKVVDLDQTTESRDFYDRLIDMDTVNPDRVDAETAATAVRKGNADAYLVITEGYGAAQSGLFDAQVPTVRLVIDPRRDLTLAMLEGILMGDAAEQLQDQFADPMKMLPDVDLALAELQASDGSQIEGYDQLLGLLNNLKSWMEISEEQSLLASDDAGGGFTLQPLVIESEKLLIDRARPTTSFDISFPQSLVWAIIGCITTFAVSLVTERSGGTLLRLTIAPISRAQILVGKLLACFVAVLSVCSVLLFIGWIVFDLSIQSPGLLALALVTAAFCFSGLMMALSVLGKTEKSASGMTWAVLMPMAMLGGGMIPLAVMPSWMAAFSDLSPVKWAVLSFEGAMWRGFSLTEMLTPLLIMTAVGAISMLLGVRLFKFQAA